MELFMIVTHEFGGAVGVSHTITGLKEDVTELAVNSFGMSADHIQTLRVYRFDLVQGEVVHVLTCTRKEAAV